MAGAGLAIIAGRGVLPRLIAEDCAARGEPYLVVVIGPEAAVWAGDHPSAEAEFEKPGRLFSLLREADCGRVTFAGGVTRPSLNPLRYDRKMLSLAPKILGALRAGDDSTLRVIAGIFEAEGLEVVAAHDVLSGLLVPDGLLTRTQPTDDDRSDAERAAEIARTLGGVDVGQGCVVAQGICLGVESIQGTDAMLEFVARTGAGFRPDPAGAKGVLFKGPKPGQDWRIDLPAIGPGTVAKAQEAGLAGLVLQAGGVLLLDRERTLGEADRAGLFVWGRSAGP